jgi:alkanesulfonate monooxygenase SsuD/methylene tetrahydromethanopterin reductase-like flavin-dependent oxidoreductase (luciferase family)
MRIGLLQEGDLAVAETAAQRYEEMIAEVVRAEECGFSSWGTSEQHFGAPTASVSAPEVLFGAVARETSRITIRHMAAILVLYNHPILVAERIATVDCLSGGRAELATARSNNAHVLEALGTPLDTTREQWTEAIEIIGRAFQDDPFEYDGQFWKIPPRSLEPKPITRPHPAMSMIATGRDTPAIAGAKGLGMICWDNYLGWDYLAEQIALYRESIADAKPVGAFVNDYVGYYVATAFCGETPRSARDGGRERALAYVQAAIALYNRMPATPAYAYMHEVAARLEAHKTDLDYLINHTPTVMVGTPDELTETLRRLEALGVDEVLLRIDGFGLAQDLAVIDLIGEAVIPRLTPTAR